ncbi:SpoIID/LytB domain-containing protein [Prochlorococcus sp. MIT 0801]|uniref:SpoIID/LytB domain-containing protein n=1 Tax=Prochlorococcus sp. MIT 0801 TaxID=1501269 RepID=UPI0004F86E7E|nr:SpoIID/LytB domain-containing protein [Prochlorococcus sp. MIT 0801]AIQ97924.1 putative sporulation protein SpoIID [Prochlorococcus sp. MIT 0801]
MSASPKAKSGWSIIFVAIFFISPIKAIAAKEPIIRVLISNENKARFRADSVENIFVKGISSNHRRIKSFNLVYSNNKVKYSINNDLNSWFELPNNFNLIIRNSDKRGIWLNNRRYAGELRVSLNDKKLNIINYLKLEKYLKSVVGSEMPKDFPLAALQAQAIAARTYALKLLDKNKLFDLHSTQASQVYLGLESETVKINRAVRSTDSLVLFYKDQLIDAVFHSSSGGRTESSGQVWKYQFPYLKSVIDYDHNSSKYRWSNKFTSAELEKIFPNLGGINSIHIIDRSNTGRVLKIRLYGTNRNQIISGKDLRKKLQLLSTKFEFDLIFDPSNLDNKLNYENKLVNDSALQPLPPIPEEYFLLVRGFGAGHGVGMSQWGAKAMAERGSSFRKILKHYYTGVQIKNY